MMEYDWDKKKLERLKKELLFYKKQPILLQEKELLELYLSYIEDMENIGYLPKEKHFSFNFFSHINKTKRLLDSRLKEYLAIPKDIRKCVLNSSHVIHNLVDSCDDIELPKLNIKDDDLVSMAHDFFDWLPNPNYKKIVLKLTEKKRHLLRIQSASVDNYYGFTFPFFYSHYIPYILIDKKKNINDFCTLNHELAHAIFLHPNKTNFLAPYFSFLYELEGYFFDFLSFQFLKEKKIISNKTLTNLEISELLTVVNCMNCFYFQYLALNFYQKKKQIYIEDITRKMMEHQMPLEIDEYSLSQTLIEEPVSLVKQIFSFLVSNDLEEMFKKDRDLAFLKFETIRTNTTKSLEFILRENGITFMDDKYQNLQDKLQRLNLIKK